MVVSGLRGVGIAAVVALGLAVAPAQAQIAPPPANGFVFDGDVYDTLETGGYTYVAGDFDALLKPGKRGLQPTALATGAPLADNYLPAVEGSVLTIVPDGTGGFFLGGSFTRIGGQARANLARLRPDRTIDPAWNPGADGAVRELDLAGPQLAARGDFGTIGGKRMHAPGEFTGLAVLDPATGAATAFAPKVSGSFYDLDAIENRVYVVGRFTTSAGAARQTAALDIARGGVASWDPVPPTPPFGASRIAVSGPNVVIAFSAVGQNGQLAAYGAGTATLRWRASVPEAGAELAVNNGRVYVGPVSSFGDPVTPYALDAASGARVWTASGVLVNDVEGARVRGIAFGAGPGGAPTAFFTGNFGGASFDTRTGAAGAWKTYVGTPGGASIAVTSTAVLVGGAFTNGGAVVSDARNLVRLRADGTLDASFRPLALEDAELMYGVHVRSLRALAVDGRTLYVAGYFSAARPGVPRNGLAAIDLDTNAVTSWAPKAGEPASGAYELTVFPDRVAARDERGEDVPYGIRYFSRETGALITDRSVYLLATQALPGTYDLATEAGRTRTVEVPEPATVTVEAKVADTIVATGTASAAAAGPLAVKLTLTDAGRFIKAVYPDYAFDATATMTFPSGNQDPVIGTGTIR